MNTKPASVTIIFLLLLHYAATAQYKLQLIPADKDSAFLHQVPGLRYSFSNREECSKYIQDLPQLLRTKGFSTASVDSVEYGRDTASVVLFFGRVYKMGYIDTKQVEKPLLEYAGWNDHDHINKVLDIQQLQAMQSRILDYLENNGHPFAKVQLDSLQLENDQFSATLKVIKGPLYKIDSIRVYGDANISADFLQHYLDIPAGSIYRKARLQNIHKKLLELPYVEETQPWDITMLGTGSLLNVYLKPKRSSQVNVLIGLLPPDDQSQSGKLRVTGEAVINLRNAFGRGEQIGINWQQLQVKSPRLDLSFAQPYIFGMPFGVAGSFNLFKKDSSFINLGLQIGLQYTLSTTQKSTLFLQNLTTNLLTPDTIAIKNTKTLPVERDVSSVSLGIDYEFNKTDYRLNPRRGWELNTVVSAGTRRVRKNNVITKLQDEDGFNYAGLYDSVLLNSYQFRIRFSGARYFQLGRRSTLKTGLNGGWLQSPEIYRNELFQIGGYRLLRGFDEQSIYASQYATGTLEYRYLIGLNSFIFSFIDAGWTANKSVRQNTRNNFVSGGLGLAFETKAGVFNISYAAGKRGDATFNLRTAKIHLGYVSYF